MIALYKEFFKALKPTGILTTPPALSKKSPWKNYCYKEILRQNSIFSEILKVRWQVYSTEDQIIKQLKEVGFKAFEIIYDAQCILPTVIAKKL